MNTAPLLLVFPVPSALEQERYSELALTNDAPTDHQYHSLVQSRNISLQLLDSEHYLANRIDREKLQQSIRLHSSILHPIRKFPPEILEAIFKWATLNSRVGGDTPTRIPDDYPEHLPSDIAGSEVDDKIPMSDVEQADWPTRARDDSHHERPKVWVRSRSGSHLWSGTSTPVRVLPGPHRHPWCLLFVSKSWRQTVVATPELWSQLEIGRPVGFELPFQKGMEMLMMQTRMLQGWQDRNRTAEAPEATLPPVACAMTIRGLDLPWESQNRSAEDILAATLALPLSDFFVDLTIKMASYYFNQLLPPYKFSQLVSLSVDIPDMHSILDNHPNGWTSPPDYSVFDHLPHLRVLWMDTSYLARFSTLPLPQLTSYFGFPRDTSVETLPEDHWPAIEETLDALHQMSHLRVCHVRPSFGPWTTRLDDPRVHPEDRLTPVPMLSLRELQCTIDGLQFLDVHRLEVLEIVAAPYSNSTPDTMLGDLVAFCTKNPSLRLLRLHQRVLSGHFIASVLEQVNLRELEVYHGFDVEAFSVEYPAFSGIHISNTRGPAQIWS